MSGRRGSPTIETLVAFALVFGLQMAVSFVGLMAFFFVLAPPVDVRPWTLVTSVYAHGGMGHLLSNALALLVFGLLVERRTTRVRFHAFFITTGVLAGIAQITLGSLAGPPQGVLGASGAIFALMGYVLAGNVVSTTLFDRVRLSGRLQFLLFVLFAALVTVATGAPGVALIAHFTGLVLGLVAGRAGLLDVH
ncbi:rhomboid family intramembrane serine protease [Halalkalicoccus subterraneus]|uniref:rhomboid family intramembrane serine protease n=1 Tax=Halalkalicoccus subterraneus TaxID=2675002 RepID=UPI000EFB5F50|nr:rhomboid family intramembrane serine protease [Halalkalicoccus subterraneus]